MATPAEKTPTNQKENGCEPVSLRERLKTARHTATGPIDFWTQCRHALARQGFFGFLMGFIGIPLSMLIQGAVNTNRCAAQPLVPIWMIVGGSVAVTLMLTNAIDIGLYWCTNRGPGHDLATKIINGITAVGIVFLFAWLIVGSIWVFGIWPPNTSDNTSPNYCIGGMYYYAFALLILGYISTAALIMCCGHIFCSQPPSSHVEMP